jgi:hypothetical protein
MRTQMSKMRYHKKIFHTKIVYQNGGSDEILQFIIEEDIEKTESLRQQIQQIDL